ncbi:MAG: hypothetical protein DI616_15720 [Paracoccus denitrificans]|uniref:Uncharacterized protein n=1 Tax=Paracoccus denitrificans TaxID=266 RepID=A0A533I479_PARDE|nr:MAG: hypothetical protein DI616_15720 [Paracoccus denitrificans]
MLPVEYHVTLNQAKPLVEDCLDAGLVPILRGSPALGKSALAASIAKERNLLLIDERFAGYDPTDMNGFPDLDKDAGIAKYFPLETFPLDDWELPINPETNEPYAGWLVLADELTSAVPAVQAASYKLFLDRKVGQRNLHPKAYLMAAGNLDSDNAITHEMSTALISRLINIQVILSQKDWLDWATKNGIHSLITSFIDYKGAEFFYTFDAENPNQPFAAARTWEFASKLIYTFAKKGVSVSSRVSLLAGTVGAGAAVGLAAFAATWGQLPTLAEIMADPKTCRTPDSPGAQYAMTGALGEWATADNLPKLIEYYSRMRADMQVITLRNINNRHPELKQHPAAIQWMVDNQDKFLG